MHQQIDYIKFDLNKSHIQLEAEMDTKSIKALKNLR